MTVETTPTFDELAGGYRRWAASMKDLRAPLAAIGKLHRAEEAVLFDAEGSGRWRPLTAEYAAQKAQKAPGRPTLVLSGALRRSLVKGGPTAVLRVGRTGLVVGTRLQYAQYQADAGRDPLVDVTSGRFERASLAVWERELRRARKKALGSVSSVVVEAP